MALLDDVAEDLGGIRDIFPQIYQPDPRPGYRGSYVDGPAIRVALMKLDARQRNDRGADMTLEMYRVFARINAPIKEEQRLRYGDVVLIAVAVKPIEAPGDEGLIIECRTEER